MLCAVVWVCGHHAMWHALGSAWHCCAGCVLLECCIFVLGLAHWWCLLQVVLWFEVVGQVCHHCSKLGSCCLLPWLVCTFILASSWVSWLPSSCWYWSWLTHCYSCLSAGKALGLLLCSSWLLEHSASCCKKFGQSGAGQPLGRWSGHHS